jgi:hypothetical protein
LPIASETESLAVQLVRALNDTPDGRPMQWRMIEQLDGATADALAYVAPSDQGIATAIGVACGLDRRR